MMKEKRNISVKKKVIISVAVILCFILVVTIAFSAVLFNFALNTESSVHMTKLVNMNTIAAEDESSVEYSGVTGTAEEKQWYETARKSINVESDDGLVLHAYECKNPSSDGKYAIICHGYSTDASYMAHSAKKFYDWGYSVVAPDARAHGKSEGSIIGMGWPERLDLLKWISYITANEPDAQLVLYGISMGAATVMMASGEDLPANVKAIVEDCGYSSVFDEFEWQAKSMFSLPAFPFLHIASVINYAVVGYNLMDADATAQVAKSNTPTLFIHGDSDVFVPFEMLDELYEAASCEKQKLVIEGAGHAMSSGTEPELYWQTVKDFIEKYM